MADEDGDLYDRIELPSGHVFRLRSVQDMFKKLYREFTRYEEAVGDRNTQIDAALNFAVTAWHIWDWAWQQHADTLRRHSASIA